MAHAKDKYYWTQLRAALTAGQWSSPSPGTAPNGSPLSWYHILRKFNKHCKGFQDVAEVASQTQALFLLLGADTEDVDQLGLENDDELVLGDECLLPLERIEEARGGYEILRSLDSKNFDSLQHALALYAYALGQFSECLSYLLKVPKLSEAQSHTPPFFTTRSDNSALQVPGSITETSSSWTGSFVSAESPGSPADIKDGRAWAIIESIRSICLQGMCCEKLSQPKKAIEVYSSALPLLSSIESEIPRTLVATHSSSASFDNYRELWRWTERLMFRTISLLARFCCLDENDGLIWTMFTHYHTCSAHWPAIFRTGHRSTVAVLHIRALIIQYQTSSATTSPSSSPQSAKPPQWISTARSVIYEYRTILGTCTTFPKAGERNVKVEDFVDLCMAVWETNGAMSDRVRWVLDMLWWATRLTFNSYRIYRHMTRLLSISGDVELAKRTLRLYVQVVTKAREAGVDDDFDTDGHWVETLINGARMLCRLTISRQDGIDDAKEAGDMIEKAKTRLDEDDKEMVARVALAEGVYYTTLAIIEQDPYTRQARLGCALAAYLKSVATYPTSAAHHQLAIALSLPGSSQNVDEAIISARAAVEDDADEIRHWHLLGLLLSANGEWEKAAGVLEVGADLDESKQDAENTADDVVAKAPMADDIQAKDFELDHQHAEVNGHSKRPAAHLPNDADGLTSEHKRLLDPHATTIPPSATLLRPLPDHPLPSSCDAFYYALQLRMTQMALAEHVEGPEGAEGRWVDVFGWVAERKGSPSTSGSMTETQPRSSMDTGTGARTTQTSSVLHQPSQDPVNEKGPSADQHGSLSLSLGQQDLPLSELPPITVTPATPADPHGHFPFSMDEKDSPKGRRSSSADGTGRKVQQMLKARVHKGQERISTISRKLGHGVVRNGYLKRTSSAPDFHAVLQNHNYQASSIHSRRRLRSLIRHNAAATPIESPPAPPPPLPPVPEETPTLHATKDDKLISDLWTMSAATFRRLGKIEQAKAAIQEAEVKDSENPAVWVQLGLYYTALDRNREALEAFQKALFISPDHIAACVHLCRIHLSTKSSTGAVDSDKVDLVVGILGHITRGPGWDVPEAWYYLAKAYGLQGRKDKERESLTTALALSDQRSIRDIGRAVGWCL
jgi:tetratricopeptide (TPR) repeat protein